MSAPKLPKAERAIIAAHEAGMHDKHPKPETCRPCAQDASAQRAFGDMLVINPPKPEPLPKPRKVVRREAEPKPADVPQNPDVPQDVEQAPVAEQPVYTSREAWLIAGVDALAPIFEAAGFPLVPVRVSVGWPAGRSAKSNTIGQCFQGPLTEDHVPAIFISPVLTDPLTVLDTLTHELCHAVVEPSAQAHRGPFVKVAKAVGLTGKWTATVAGPELKDILIGIAEKLGPFTHSKVSKGIGRKVQTTRMLKVACGGCGCVIRMTRKWLDDAGLPTCGCGGEMHEEVA